MAAGINNTARQLGIAFGVAGLGTYFQSRVAARLEAIEGVDPDALAQLVVGGAFDAAAEGAPARVRDEVAALAPDAFFAGLDELLLVLAVTGAVVATRLIHSRDFVIPLGGRP